MSKPNRDFLFGARFTGERWLNELVLRSATRILALFFWALALTHAVKAQVLYGSLTGNVTDQAGAAVTGAKVEASNVSTGVTQVTTTDERSGFRRTGDCGRA